MNLHGNQVILAFLAVTIVMAMLVIFVFLFSQLFQRRQAQHRAEKQALHEAYQREILQAQVETQNQTFQHIGGELHDHIGQLLAVAMLQLNVLDEDLNNSPHHSAVQQTGSLVAQVITDLRALSKTLNGDAIGQLGLVDSINLELDRIRRTGRYQTQLTVMGDARPLDQQAGIILFRMVQESISNTLKHARAKTISVAVNYTPGHLVLRIADDGRGFAADQIPKLQSNHTGQGLSSLNRRAGFLSGTCTVNSQPGEGCVVMIDIPLT